MSKTCFGRRQAQRPLASELGLFMAKTQLPMLRHSARRPERGTDKSAQGNALGTRLPTLKRELCKGETRRIHEMDELLDERLCRPRRACVSFNSRSFPTTLPRAGKWLPLAGNAVNDFSAWKTHHSRSSRPEPKRCHAKTPLPMYPA